MSCSWLYISPFRTWNLLSTLIKNVSKHVVRVISWPLRINAVVLVRRRRTRSKAFLFFYLFWWCWFNTCFRLFINLSSFLSTNNKFSREKALDLFGSNLFIGANALCIISASLLTMYSIFKTDTSKPNGGLWRNTSAYFYSQLSLCRNKRHRENGKLLPRRINCKTQYFIGVDRDVHL